MQYSLEVEGVNGVYNAKLSHNGSLVASSDTVSSHKDARKWAQAVARQHREDNLPHNLESYRETFSL